MSLLSSMDLMNHRVSIGQPAYSRVFSCECIVSWLQQEHLSFHFAGYATIQEDMTLTVDSDLNGKSPQFTLTCTSTGGSATTVTWTRDSETVSGGITVLENATTAQYTHTLTVTGRLGGQYQCTVSSNETSRASANFTVQGGVCGREERIIS